MKKTWKFFTTAVLCAAIGFVVACGTLVITNSGRIFALTYIVTALLAALAMGAFDGDAAECENIKKRNKSSYGQAAVFIGSACLFMGTPQQCEDVCQDLWHYGQQAEVRQLTDETEFNIL